MAYQVIARKWRSQTFDQLIGQSHITTTLQNALKNNRLPHALLFTGPRGTGKTSSARILAKALRCPNAKDFIPCNNCPECHDISTSRSVDVIEIDGASNNGVDSIRELREGVAFMPSSGKYKIYIIDEVHMLSTSAFNALLKTLEEPPEHVIFILATTEVHKIPQTILSRCQRFDFRRIPTKLITNHLKTICETEGIQAEEESLWMIARQGDGSMRDSQSLLDQVVTFANGPLTKANVVEILGLTDHTLLLEALAALVARDTAAVMGLLEKVSVAGYEPHLFATNLLENVRNLLLIKVSNGRGSDLIELPDSEMRLLENMAQKTSEEDIHMLFDMALKGAGDIARSSEPRIVLEMTMLRMATAPFVESLAELIRGGSGLSIGGQKQKSTATVAVTHSSAPIPQTKKPTPIANMSMQDRWFEFVQHIREKDALFAAKVDGLLFVSEKNKVIELSIPQKLVFLKDQLADSSVREKLQGLLDFEFGTGYVLNIKLEAKPTKEAPVTGTSAQEMAQIKEEKKHKDLMSQVAEHPKVKAAALAFKGQIKSVKETP